MTVLRLTVAGVTVEVSVGRRPFPVWALPVDHPSFTAADVARTLQPELARITRGGA